jgi:hypothetical protein
MNANYLARLAQKINSRSVITTVYGKRVFCAFVADGVLRVVGLGFAAPLTDLDALKFTNPSPVAAPDLPAADAPCIEDKVNSMMADLCAALNDLKLPAVVPAMKAIPGCALGFRIAHQNCDAGTLAALRAGEEATRRHAMIHNGKHPAFQNGKTLVHGWFTLDDAGNPVRS